jgi:DNA-binding transcriptional LysR family regulator
MPAPINLNRFDLTSLRLLVAAVDGGSLTAGAERMGLSLAAASKRMVELEAHVGHALLNRSKRGVRPTPAGQALMRHAVSLVAGLEQLALAMDDLHRGASGQLRLWANTSAFGGFLPPLLAAFAQAHPDVVLDLEDALSDDAVRAVANGVAELAVIGENTVAEGLQSMRCHTDELVLMLPPDHPLAAGGMVPLAMALRHDWVALGRGTSLTRQLGGAAQAMRLPLKIRVHVRSFDAMARMVAAGMGVAVLPRTGAAPLAAALGLVLVPLSGFRTERRLLLAWRDRAALSPPALTFVALVEARQAMT